MLNSNRNRGRKGEVFNLTEGSWQWREIAWELVGPCPPTSVRVVVSYIDPHDAQGVGRVGTGVEGHPTPLAHVPAPLGTPQPRVEQLDDDVDKFPPAIEAP